MGRARQELRDRFMVTTDQDGHEVRTTGVSECYTLLTKFGCSFSFKSKMIYVPDDKMNECDVQDAVEFLCDEWDHDYKLESDR